MRSFFVLLPILGLMGCELLEAPPSTELEGIYTIDTWTEDDPGCDNGNMSNLLMSRFTVVAANNIARGSHLFAYPCVEVDTCADLQDNSILPGLVPFSSSTGDGDDATGWTGSTENEFVDPTDDDVCRVSRTSWVLEADGPDGVVRMTEVVSGTLPTAEVDCDEVGIDDVPEADRCTATSTLSATFEQPLPPPPAD